MDPLSSPRPHIANPCREPTVEYTEMADRPTDRPKGAHTGDHAAEHMNLGGLVVRATAVLTDPLESKSTQVGWNWQAPPTPPQESLMDTNDPAGC